MAPTLWLTPVVVVAAAATAAAVVVVVVIVSGWLVGIRETSTIWIRVGRHSAGPPGAQGKQRQLRARQHPGEREERGDGSRREERRGSRCSVRSEGPTTRRVRKQSREKRKHGEKQAAWRGRGWMEEEGREKGEDGEQ